MLRAGNPSPPFSPSLKDNVALHAAEHKSVSNRLECPTVRDLKGGQQLLCHSPRPMVPY